MSEKCPKCGCDWNKWHHLTNSGSNDYHCINCGNHTCFHPAGFMDKLSDLEEAKQKALQELEWAKRSTEAYVKRLDAKIAFHKTKEMPTPRKIYLDTEFEEANGQVGKPSNSGKETEHK